MRPAAGATLALAAAFACSEPAPRPCGGGPDGLTTVCGLALPEDLVFVPAKRAILASEMGFEAPARGGGVSVLELGSGELRPRRLWPDPAGPERAPEPRRGDASCALPPNPDGFSGHGLDAATLDSETGATSVAVVGHGDREAVELFDLRGEGVSLELVWRGCVPLPEETAGNDVAIGEAGTLYVTNYIPTVHGLRAWLALRRGDRGEPTGDLIVWTPQRGWRHLPGTEAALPNGVAVAPGGEAVFFAENGSSRLVRVSLPGGGRASGPLLSGRPDNLSWTPRGTLLAALLLTDAPGTFEVVEVDPASLEARKRFAHDGSRIHSVTAAVEIEGALFLGSMADDRLAVWRAEPAEDPEPE